MTRRLQILRHAKSSWDDPLLADHARPLNARGRQAATAMRRVLDDGVLREGEGARGGGAPDLVLVSSARRTLQTLQALGAFDPQPRVTPLDALYLAGASQLLDVLTSIEDTVSRVLLIGHNPGLHDLCMRLAAAPGAPSTLPVMQRLAEGFPTGAFAEFSVAGPWWSIADGGTRLTRFVVPRELPELAL
jgi:phosphohistidine phosphatase